MAEKTTPKWEAAARMTILGPQHNLESLPGYWFRPRKYSTIGATEIAMKASQMGGALPRAIMKRLVEATKDKELDAKEAMALLSEDEIDQVLKAQNEKGSESVEIQRAVLAYGIGDHNFDGYDTIEGLAGALLDYPSVTAEMLGVIREWNRPLAETTSEKSVTS